jgi:hypothetical protein
VLLVVILVELFLLVLSVIASLTFSYNLPFKSPGPNVLGYAHGVGAAAGNSDHVLEEYIYLRNIARATGAHKMPSEHRTRAKPRGRPVTSDRPPPRRCGQAAWAATGRPPFCYRGVRLG